MPAILRDLTNFFEDKVADRHLEGIFLWQKPFFACPAQLTSFAAIETTTKVARTSPS
jgi:hypothetical protein